MTVVIEKHICDMCKREISTNFTPGVLTLSYSGVDWSGNGFPAGCEYRELCADCCKTLDSAISLVAAERTGGKDDRA